MSLTARVRSYATLVSFSHTVFALPFAASAVVLALAMPHPPLTWTRLLAMLICMVAARTSAMAWNRWADRDIDAKNPRTASRPIQRGDVRPVEALGLTFASALVFVFSASTLGTMPAVLSIPVLLVLLGYSYAKRFTWGAHAWLGVALALAPGGAWIAVGAPVVWGIVALMLAVVTWLLGFDVLYSLQDEGFDREERLHSIPSRFGMARSLAISAAAHLVTVFSLALTGALLHRGVVYFVGVSVVAALLVWEHLLIHPPLDASERAASESGASESGVSSRWARADLRKIDKAFFDMNAWISVGFFAATLLDELLRR